MPNHENPSFADTLPTLLASSLRELETEHDPFHKLWAVCDLVENTLRLLATAGIAEHERDKELPSGLTKEIAEGLQRPTMGIWFSIANAVARHAPANSVLPALLGTVNSVDKLLKKNGLSELRNRLAHGAFNRRGDSQGYWEQWEPLIRTWVAEHLAWLADTAFITVDEAGQRFLMRGEFGEEQDSGLWPVPQSAPPSSAWLCVGQTALHLGPLAESEPDGLHPLVYMRGDKVRLQYLRLGHGTTEFQDSTPEAMKRFRQRFRLDAAHESPGLRGEIRKEAARRVGRQAELEKVLAAIRAPGAGSLWLGGPAGSGKSCLMAAVMQELDDHPVPDICFVPYRFRAGDGRCNQLQFLLQVAESIGRSACLKTTEKAEPQRGRTGSSVSDIQDLLKLLRPGASVLLVLDGLDEIAAVDRGFARVVLQPLHLSGVRIVGAGRPEAGLPELFAGFGAAEPYPAGIPPLAEEDTRAMILQAIDGNRELRKRLFARDTERRDQIQNDFIRAIVKQSEGSPLYVNYVIGDLCAGLIGPENELRLPPRLNGYHDRLIERLSVGDLQAVTTPCVVLLAEAKESLSVSELAALLCRRGVLAAPDQTLVERAIAYLSSMIRNRDTRDGEDTYTLFHHSLRQHILGRPDLQHQVTLTRRLLVEAAQQPWGDAAEVYLLRHGVAHLVENDQCDRALGLITDFDFLMRRFQRLDSTGQAAEGWYRDWDLVWQNTPVAGEPLTWWNFARSSRHIFWRPGVHASKTLLQLALEYCVDSPVTEVAEAWLGRQDQTVTVLATKARQRSSVLWECEGVTSMSGGPSCRFLYVAREHEVAALDPETGATQWQVPTGKIKGLSKSRTEGGCIHAILENGTGIALDLETGEQRDTSAWIEVDQESACISADGERIYFLDVHGRTVSFLWDQQGPPTIHEAPNAAELRRCQIREGVRLLGDAADPESVWQRLLQQISAGGEANEDITELITSTGSFAAVRFAGGGVKIFDLESATPAKPLNFNTPAGLLLSARLNAAGTAFDTYIQLDSGKQRWQRWAIGRKRRMRVKGRRTFKARPP